MLNNNLFILFKEREATLNDLTILKRFDSFIPTYTRKLADGYDNEYHIYNVNGSLTASDENNDKQFSENHKLIARIFYSYTDGHYYTCVYDHEEGIVWEYYDFVLFKISILYDKNEQDSHIMLTNGSNKSGQNEEINVRSREECMEIYKLLVSKDHLSIISNYSVKFIATSDGRLYIN